MFCTLSFELIFFVLKFLSFSFIASVV